MIEKALEEFPLVLDFKVHWGEMDSANHVNNLVYLRWSETARVEYFSRLEIDTSFKTEEAPILGYQDIKYIFPVTFPDKIYVGIKVDKIEKDRFNMLCHLYSEKHQRIIAISNHQAKAYNYKLLSKIDLPDDWIQSIKRFQKE